MHDHEGSIRAKVLGELMTHMIGMHGGSKSSSLPHADGTPKHEHSKVEGLASIISEPTHEDAEIPEEHDPDDLFGRRGGKKMAF